MTDGNGKPRRVGRLRRYARNSSGTIAIVFGLTLIPIMLAGGVALDFATIARNRSRLQAAADSAALAVAGMPTATQAQRAAHAKNRVMANLGAAGAGLNVGVTESEPSSGVYRVAANATVPMKVLTIAGIKSSPIAVSAQAETTTKAVEIAMALDVSGSMLNADMSGSRRIDVLKTSATALVDTVSGNIPPSATLRIGYVPFTMNVNIGTANSAYVTDANSPLFAGTQWAGCVTERQPPEHISNAYDGSDASAKGRWKAYIQPPEPNSNGSGYGGCFGASNGSNNGYASIDPYIAGDANSQTKGPNFNCVRESIRPLTTDLAAVKSGLSGLRAVGNNGTMVAPGLSWALRLLTPNAPFPGASPFSVANRKVIVALTDGQQTTEAFIGGRPGNASCTLAHNTATPYSYSPAAFKLSGKSLSILGPRDNFSAYGYVYDSDPFGKNYSSTAQVDASLDELLLQACAFAKAQKGVEVFTIAVSSAAGPGTSVYNSLSACASDSNHFFYATDSSALTAAFTEIGRRAAAPAARLTH